MLVSNLEIAGRDRRITGLREMLRTLRVHSLVFTIRLVIEDETKELVMEDWYGYDRNQIRVDIQEMNLPRSYTKDICFLVRDEHELITGRWCWDIESDSVRTFREQAEIVTVRT